MKNILYIIICCCFISGIISCGGKKSASVKVTVFDLCLNEVVSGATVGLFEDKGNESKITKLTEGSTDANGEVLFNDFKTYTNNNYGYYVQVTNYFGKESEFSIHNSNPLDKGTYNDHWIKMISSANLLVKFVSPPPYAAGDSMFVNFRQKYTGFNYDKNSYNYHEGYAKVDAGKYYITIYKYYASASDTIHHSDSISASGVFSKPRLDSISIDPNTSKEYDVAW